MKNRKSLICLLQYIFLHFGSMGMVLHICQRIVHAMITNNEHKPLHICKWPVYKHSCLILCNALNASFMHNSITCILWCTGNTSGCNTIIRVELHPGKEKEKSWFPFNFPPTELSNLMQDHLCVIYNKAYAVLYAYVNVNTIPSTSQYRFAPLIEFQRRTLSKYTQGLTDGANR